MVREAPGADLAGRLRGSAEWRLLGVLTHAAPRLAAAWWVLVALRAALPAGFALAMGALVTAVQGRQAPGPVLALAGAAFSARSAAGHRHDAVGSNLGARVSAWLHDRLLEACVSPLGIAYLERPDLADELAMAREFDLGITGPNLATSVPRIGAGFAELAAGGARALLLTAYHWWAGLAVGGAWLATHFLLRDSSAWKAWQDESVVAEQRHVNYAYRLAVDAPGAKEVRLFGLADWVVERFRARRLRMVEAIFEARRLRLGPLRWGLAAVVVANAAVFWSLAADVGSGRIGLGWLVVFAQGAVGASSLAFGEVDWWFGQSAQPIPRVLGLAERTGPVGWLRPGAGGALGPCG